jgi:arylsulfatase
MKLVRKKTWELYDLSKDRTETGNLASKQPELAAKMEADWNAWFTECTGEVFADAKARREAEKKANNQKKGGA